MKDAIREGRSEPKWLYQVRSTEPARMSLSPSDDESTWLHLKSGTGAIRFMFIYETFGPPGYASTMKTQLGQIAQAHSLQRAIIDGIARSGKRVLFKYPGPNDYARAGVEENPMPGTWWARSLQGAGQGSLVFYDPYYHTVPMLFENTKTKRRKKFVIDWEEILSHELFHVWAYSKDDGIVKIGEPSYQEARRRIVPEGYAIRYINKLRKQQGSEWIRIVHTERGDAVILDGEGHGNVIPL